MLNIFSIGSLGGLWQGVKLCHFQCKLWVAITTVVLPYNWERRQAKGVHLSTFPSPSLGGSHPGSFIIYTYVQFHGTLPTSLGGSISRGSNTIQPIQYNTIHTSNTTSIACIVLYRLYCSPIYTTAVTKQL